LATDKLPLYAVDSLLGEVSCDFALLLEGGQRADRVRERRRREGDGIHRQNGHKIEAPKIE
jgi:hypothetical protein